MMLRAERAERGSEDRKHLRKELSGAEEERWGPESKDWRGERSQLETVAYNNRKENFDQREGK